MLNFLCRNLYKCNQEVRCTTYIHLVRPMLVWCSQPFLDAYKNPPALIGAYLAKDINSLEMVHRREAQWATSNYDWQSGISISSTINNLQWLH